MPGNEILLDTNAFIAWWNEDAALAHQVVGMGESLLSLISLAELMLGAKKSGRPRENLEALNLRIQDFRLLTPDHGTAEHWADVSWRSGAKAARYLSTTYGSPRSRSSTASRSGRAMRISTRSRV